MENRQQVEISNFFCVHCSFSLYHLLLAKKAKVLKILAPAEKVRELEVECPGCNGVTKVVLRGINKKEADGDYKIGN